MKIHHVTQTPHVAIDAARQMVSCAHCGAAEERALLPACGFVVLAVRFVRAHWTCARPGAAAHQRFRDEGRVLEMPLEPQSDAKESAWDRMQAELAQLPRPQEVQ